MPEKLLTTNEVAAITRMHADNVRRWCARNNIPVVPLGPRAVRYRASDLEAGLERLTVRYDAPEAAA